MSELDLASPKPSLGGHSPSLIRTTLSPRLDVPASGTSSRSQIDALPAEARSPRKSTNPSPLNVSSLGRRIVDLEPLPHFSDVSEGQWSKLFTKKIIQCEVIFDFSMPIFDIRNKEIKAGALNDILWMTTEHPASLGEQQYQEVFVMFAKNVFRAIPPSPNPVGEEFDPEDDEPLYDPSWPHTHLIYEILIRLVESHHFNTNIAKKFIDQLFVYRLLVLFDVEDPRERDMVKTAVHRVYGKFLNLRAFIRKAMKHVFYEFVYEDERHNIAEMLEILGSVVNGFAVPLRDEHKVFLERTLIPLHKNRFLPLYYSQLSLCIIQYAEKDSSLVPTIILGLLRLWPKTNTTKELMFLNEIEEILDVTPAEHFAAFLQPLMQQLARSIASQHFQVAERALSYWNNEYLVSIVSDHLDAILPIVLPTMLRYSRAHWNKNVQLQVLNSLRLFMDLSPKLYESIARTCETQESDPAGRSGSLENRNRKWAIIEEIARKNLASSSATLSTLTISPSDESGSRRHSDRRKHSPTQESSAGPTSMANMTSQDDRPKSPS